jgi:hypothetical protein
MEPFEKLRRKLEIGSWSPRIGEPSFQFRSSSFHFPFSGFFPRWRSRLALLVVAVITFGASRMAHAQGCAMCYTSASAARAGAIQALRSGILILLIPTLLVFAATAVLVIRRRNQFNEIPDWTQDHDRELRDLLAGMKRAGEREVHESEIETHSPVS